MYSSLKSSPPCSEMWVSCLRRLGRVDAAVGLAELVLRGFAPESGTAEALRFEQAQRAAWNHAARASSR